MARTAGQEVRCYVGDGLTGRKSVVRRFAGTGFVLTKIFRGFREFALTLTRLVWPQLNTVPHGMSSLRYPQTFQFSSRSLQTCSLNSRHMFRHLCSLNSDWTQ